MPMGWEFGRFGLEFVMTIIAVWGVIAKSQASLKAELQGTIEQLSERHALSLKESREQFSSMSDSFKTVGLQINTIMEGHVRDLQSRVTRLESGQDEWTKELRMRTHDLAGQVDRLGFEVEFLKKGKQRHGD